MKPMQIDLSKNNNQFEAVKFLLDSQLKLLQALTNIDLRLFFGYLISQFVVASFIVTNTSNFGIAERVCILIIELALTLLIVTLINKNRRRRDEVRVVVIQCNMALRYTDYDAYNNEERLIPQTKEDLKKAKEKVENQDNYSSWGLQYQLAIMITAFGFMALVLSPVIKPFLDTNKKVQIEGGKDLELEQLKKQKLE